MSSLPVISQPAHRCAALIDHLARRMRMRAETVLTPLGLRPRHLVALTMLRDHADSTQQSLSALLQIDRTNLVGLLNELESWGLIERRRSDEDRRRHTVHLTQPGAERLAQAEFALAAVEDEILASLDGEQRETLYELLQIAGNGRRPDCARPVDEVDCR
jgi:MarR family transcriptional regulator, lower aerobic nicotinate degradation pathway regulator